MAAYISEKEAAKRLGVAIATVRSWVRCGRLKGVVRQWKEVVLREEARVVASSMTNAFEVRCVYCGKTFKAAHPKRAKFCSGKHKDRYFNEKKQARLRKKRNK